MKKTVIKCTSRADWGRIIQWAESIKPDCTYDSYFNKNHYFGFNASGNFFWCYPESLPSDYTVLELSDFIAYPVKKEMLVGDGHKKWSKGLVIGQFNRGKNFRYLTDNGTFWYSAKPISPNKEKIDEIDRQIAELTKQKEELCKTQ